MLLFSMKTFVIIDGHALLFQMFYGMPNKILNSHNERIEAVIGFMGAYKKIVGALQPHGLFVVFDGENELARKQVNENYKSNRTDFSAIAECDTPFPQLNIIQKILTYLNVAWCETVGEEADDTIAKHALALSLKHNVIIVSPDKDFYQLVNNNISIYCYRGKQSKLVTEKTILQQYGFDAKFFATFKALCGDSSDNIKGVYGVGAKTATQLIAQFGDASNIIANTHKIRNENVRTKIEQNIQLIKNNYEIINLQNVQLENCENKNFDCVSEIAPTNELLKALNLA